LSLQSFLLVSIHPPIIIHQSENLLRKTGARDFYRWKGGRAKDNAKVLCHLAAALPRRHSTIAEHSGLFRGGCMCVPCGSCPGNDAVIDFLLLLLQVNNNKNKWLAKQKDSQLGFLECPISTKDLLFSLWTTCQVAMAEFEGHYQDTSGRRQAH